jgi:hypothetical protein
MSGNEALSSGNYRTDVKLFTETLSNMGYRGATDNLRGIVMESDDLEPDDQVGCILSPAQRSMRCFVTLSCLVVLAMTAFYVSRPDDRASQEKFTVFAAQPKIEKQHLAQENQEKDNGKLIAVMEPYAKNLSW